MNLEIITPALDLPGCEAVANYEDMTHEEWLELRFSGIGGSDAGAVMGMSKYSSPLSLVMEKTGRTKPDDLSENEAVWFGNWMESKIRDELVTPFIQDRLGYPVEVIPPAATYRSKEHPFMLVNPDGFLNIGGRIVGLEIKTGSSYVLKNWKDDQVPDSYYAQVQHYMAGTGLDEWWVFGLIGNKRLLRVVPRNQEFIDRMIQAEKEIWEIIQENNPLNFPIPNGSDSDMVAIMAIGSPQNEDVRMLPDDDYKVIRYIDLGVEMSDRKEERDRLKQELIQSMGTAKYGETENHRLSFSRFNRSTFDKKAFEKDHPGMIAPYVTDKEQGRLYVKGL